MKKRRFGGDDKPSRDDLEREAQEELNRLARRSGAPQSWYSPPASPPPAAPPPVAPSGPPGRPGYSPPAISPRPWAQSGTPGPSWRPPEPPAAWAEPEDEEGEEDWEPPTAAEEEEAITELALRDWAEHRGRGGIEDYALPRLDPGSIEAQRDRALREFMDRQQRMGRAAGPPRSPATSGGGRASAPQGPWSRKPGDLPMAAKPAGMMNLKAQAAAIERRRAAEAAGEQRPKWVEIDPDAAEDGPVAMAPAPAAKAPAKSAAAAKATKKAPAKATKAPAKATKKAPAKATKAPAKATTAPTTKAPTTKAPAKATKAPGKTAKATKRAPRSPGPSAGATRPSAPSS